MPQNLFPYPGNKARHAEWIIQHVPEHTCYVEPFGGAAGVLFNKPKSKVEVYNDLDGDIVHFFEVLRDRGDELQEWLECVPFSRQLHEQWAAAFYDGERPDDDIERAGRFFYLRYSQFGGKTQSADSFATKTTDNPAGYLRRSVESLDQFAQRLRDVTVENQSWDEVFSRYDKPHSVFYLDPPYQGTERYYGSGGFDHYELFEMVADAEARCLISHDSIPHWYGDGFEVVSKSGTRYINTSGQKDATEYLIMNFDADGEPLMSDVGQQGLDAFGD